jgi:hypothetical protein
VESKATNSSSCEYIIGNALYWLTDYKVSDFTLDLVGTSIVFSRYDSFKYESISVTFSK